MILLSLIILTLIIATLSFAATLFLLAKTNRERNTQLKLEGQLQQLALPLHQISEKHTQLREIFLQEFMQLQKLLNEQQVKNLQLIQNQLENGLTQTRQQTLEALHHNIKLLTEQVAKLTQATEHKLLEISGQVEKRLSEGFEKTSATFVDIVKRLALIDEAQKKITELSTNVVSLQEILADRKSRGAFGEVQLNSLVRNVLPTTHFNLQHTLSNGKRADCFLLLPPPTGNVVIDAKFPLESYRNLITCDNDAQKPVLQQQFRHDIRKHIYDIAERYIIPGETSDGAVMFIPAEAVFAEIHSHFYDVVEEAQLKRVWLVSPTTMMAILTTARAVLKDDATRQQVHIIQDHLRKLAEDFNRFRDRMTKLSQHIKLANSDVDLIHTSAKKISQRFDQIEQVDLGSEAETTLLE